MCGIIGVWNKENAYALVKKCAETISSRGCDRVGYYDGSVHYASMLSDLPPTKSSSVLVHLLHAVVSYVPQPIKWKDHILAANCEIYNWKELAKKYNISVQNDAELILHLLVKLGLRKTLREIHGVYAFAYENKEKVYICRDILGEKPMWYAYEDGTFATASEKKALVSFFKYVEELNPRQIIVYNKKTKTINVLRRSFFSLGKEISDEKLAIKKLHDLLLTSVRMRVPEKKFGLLFSGGIDSLIIARILQQLECSFTCYTAVASETAPDFVAAQETAKRCGLELSSIIVRKENVSLYLKKIVPLIEDTNVVKVGVALPLFIAAERAYMDGVKVLFSGTGADELFAGYHRYKSVGNLKDLNKDAYSDLLKLYERNTYRDDVVAMNNSIELRSPFLDTRLVSFALHLAPRLKLHVLQEKYILRRLAEHLGIPSDLAQRKKKAAQYGSGFDQVIEDNAKKEKKTRSAYLFSFYKKPNLRLGALVSSGKDSLYSLYLLKKQNYEISCLMTLYSANKDSFMFQEAGTSLVQLQAEAMGIPLVKQKTRGVKEKELKDLEKVLKKAKEQYHIEGVVTGAIASNYQRSRIEVVCDRLGLKIFSPLWHVDQFKEIRDILRERFRVMIVKVAAEGLGKEWLGRVLEEKDIKHLEKLHTQYDLNPSFEGGEAETVVLDCPLFTKSISIVDGRIGMENEWAGTYIIRKAVLEEKSMI